MKTQLFITLLVVLSSLTLNSNLLAQIASVTDATCTPATQCVGVAMHDCNSVNFSVTTTGTYTLKAAIDECGTTLTCPNCIAEAYIYKQDNPPSLVRCAHNSCGGSCTAGVESNVALTAGATYILYCCKIDCTNDDCSICPSGCTARATVQ